MFSVLIHPITKKNISLFSPEGKQLLRKYIKNYKIKSKQQIGGMFLHRKQADRDPCIKIDKIEDNSAKEQTCRNNRRCYYVTKDSPYFQIHPELLNRCMIRPGCSSNRPTVKLEFYLRCIEYYNICK